MFCSSNVFIWSFNSSNRLSNYKCKLLVVTFLVVHFLDWSSWIILAFEKLNIWSHFEFLVELDYGVLATWHLAVFKWFYHFFIFLHFCSKMLFKSRPSFIINSFPFHSLTPSWNKSVFNMMLITLLVIRESVQGYTAASMTWIQSFVIFTKKVNGSMMSNSLVNIFFRYLDRSHLNRCNDYAGVLMFLEFSYVTSKKIVCKLIFNCSCYDLLFSP